MTPPQLKPAPPHLLPTISQPPVRLYDISFAADFPFQHRFPPSSTPPDLHFTWGLAPPLAVDWTGKKPLYVSAGETEEGIKYFSFFSAEDCVMLKFSIMADFYLWSDLIICHLLDPAYKSMVELCLLGTVLACWFELQGILALHAAASVIEGQAVAFLSSNHGGKSSLAATLMQQGYPLLTDDILLVEAQNGRIVGRSGYPQMRMWPEQAERLFGRSKEFPKVHPYIDKRRIPIDFETPGMFENGRFPLRHCYIPERYDPVGGQAGTTITPVSPVESVLTLAGYSFLHWLFDAIGLQAQRLKTLAQVAQQVSVSHLRYPEGVAYLPAACETITAAIT